MPPWSSPRLFLLLCTLRRVDAQLRGHQTAEEHPSLIVHMCSKADGCIPTRKSVVMDANWRWIHQANGSSSCYDNNVWDQALCPDVATCGKNCAVEGISLEQYNSTYGVHTSGDEGSHIHGSQVTSAAEH